MVTEITSKQDVMSKDDIKKSSNNTSGSLDSVISTIYLETAKCTSLVNITCVHMKTDMVSETTSKKFSSIRKIPGKNHIILVDHPILITLLYITNHQKKRVVGVAK